MTLIIKDQQREVNIKLCGLEALKAAEVNDFENVRHCMEQLKKLIAARPKRVVRMIERERGLL